LKEGPAVSMHPDKPSAEIQSERFEAPVGQLPLTSSQGHIFFTPKARSSGNRSII